MSSSTAKSYLNGGYSCREIDAAKDKLYKDLDTGNLRFMRRKLVMRDTSSLPNLWEGENGCNQHVRDTFPMPERADNAGGSSSDSNILEAVPINSQGTVGEVVTSQAVNNGGFANEEHRNDENVIDNSHGDDEANESDNDCVILEEDRVVIDVQDSDDNDSHADVLVDGKVQYFRDGEMRHWQRLSRLQTNVSNAVETFSRIEKLFLANKDNDAGIALMRSLHTKLVKHVHQLASAASNIKQKNFHSVLPQNVKLALLEAKRFTEAPADFMDIWTMLNNVCYRYNLLTKKYKQALVERKLVKKLATKRMVSLLKRQKVIIDS